MPASWCFESKRSWSKKKMQKERIENWELKREGNRVENANVRLNSFDILHWSVCGNKPTSRVLLLILRLSWLLLLLLLWLLGFRANQFACLNRRSSTNNNRTIQTENTINRRARNGKNGKSDLRNEWSFVDQIGLDRIEYAFLKDDDSKRLILYLAKRLGEVTITIYQQWRINYGIMDTVQ